MSNVYAIPTVMHNVRYRSRLEARWAEFFKLLRWKAYYEPFDLNGWIPDFVIHGDVERIAVDVKPIVDEHSPAFYDTIRKIAKSGWDGDAMIVSYYLPQMDGEIFVGWLGQDFRYSGALVEKDEDPRAWALAPFIDLPGCRIGFCHSQQSYRDRITGFYEGNWGLGAADEFHIEQLWAEAGNAVQWKGRDG